MTPNDPRQYLDPSEGDNQRTLHEKQHRGEWARSVIESAPMGPDLPTNPTDRDEILVRGSVALRKLFELAAGYGWRDVMEVMSVLSTKARDVESLRHIAQFISAADENKIAQKETETDVGAALSLGIVEKEQDGTVEFVDYDHDDTERDL